MEMRRIGRALARAWARYVDAWELVGRQQRGEWEDEGPLRWRRVLGEGWELHGSVLPDEPPVRR
ncbi:hypothetical protein Acsp06_54430 [Actinomycetospora sp. NBRC 106375]|uniref:hypothetical protein n=1 Tax=Actinomycetospora sp. NBRC 106375 TaxID=3032207 RepID=UPI0024A21270|nr:hypothetical protein [Actinomycetospora sp. NBRC 106375]GLZ49258.1 hypothetical protein Acsp06_54430 [Actinomycetospora sp. NBRC 106375]